MGLDCVEIVLEVERTFNIRIADADAERTELVGEFHNLVWSILQKEGRPVEEACLTQKTFYKLRRQFMTLPG